jgi:UDP-galactopyranose mutase
VEEPISDNGSMRLDISERDRGLKVVVPRLPEGLRSEIATEAVLRQLLDRLFLTEGIRDYVLWYYTPMALEFTRHLTPMVTIYDCMDELSAFSGAPARLRELEQQLFQRADLVFTGGHSLYEAKRSQHRAVYAFPSSIDREHFAQARTAAERRDREPDDQKDIAHPRLGFFGVIDERFDIELLDSLANERPDWQFMIIGPVVKIDPAILPRLPNVHYLGSKEYKDLPAYLAGWDVALLLFARNESTRFISPTKTPEYLAAGKPVVSTSIRDVVRPYGEVVLVEIADSARDFVCSVEHLLSDDHDRESWLTRVDEFLSHISWNITWSAMWSLVSDIGLAPRRKPAVKAAESARGTSPIVDADGGKTAGAAGAG